jgi:hypothetical protein
MSAVFFQATRQLGIPRGARDPNARQSRGPAQKDGEDFFTEGNKGNEGQKNQPGLSLLPSLPSVKTLVFCLPSVGTSRRHAGADCVAGSPRARKSKAKAGI